MPSLSNQAVFAPFPLKVVWSGISLITFIFGEYPQSLLGSLVGGGHPQFAGYAYRVTRLLDLLTGSHVGGGPHDHHHTAMRLGI